MVALGYPLTLLDVRSRYISSGGASAPLELVDRHVARLPAMTAGGRGYGPAEERFGVIATSAAASPSAVTRRVTGLVARVRAENREARPLKAARADDENAVWSVGSPLSVATISPGQ